MLRVSVQGEDVYVCMGVFFFLVENTNPREFAKVDQAWCYSQK